MSCELAVLLSSSYEGGQQTRSTSIEFVILNAFVTTALMGGYKLSADVQTCRGKQGMHNIYKIVDCTVSL